MNATIAALEALLPTDNVTALREAFGTNEEEHIAELQQSVKEWQENQRLAAFRKGGIAAYRNWQPTA